MLAYLTNNSLTVACKKHQTNHSTLTSNVYKFFKLNITKLRRLIAQAQDINQGHAEKGYRSSLRLSMKKRPQNRDQIRPKPCIQKHRGAPVAGNPVAGWSPHRTI